MLNTVEKLL